MGACLEAADQKYPGFLAQVVDGEGDVHRFVRLLRNGEPLDGGPLALQASLDAGDQIEIVAAIGGG